MAKHPNTFKIKCCDRARFLLPGGVIVCLSCDPHVPSDRLQPLPPWAKTWAPPPKSL
jgi:hypothetical protein